MTGLRWMTYVLLAAGLYNLTWGLAVILYPQILFDLAGMPHPAYPQIWQCVGMIVGVYGIGYLLAAGNPMKHWVIILVGLLGKIFGPIGFAMALTRDELPLAFGATIITNDLIWWLPFAAILYQAFKNYNDVTSGEEVDLATVLATTGSHRGHTLQQLSNSGPTLVVFLRHAGCTFCRETLQVLSQQKDRIKASGVELAIVHMSSPLAATQLMNRYGLESVHRFADPQCRLYNAFNLKRGTFRQLFGFRVWIRGIVASLRGNRLGLLAGDGFRMPGAFVVFRGRITRSFFAKSASDCPDFCSLVGLNTNMPLAKSNTSNAENLASLT